jgi:uncharacterized protein (DUF58 family)
MIVPQNRLLFWFAVVALPFSVLGAVHLGAFVVALVLIGGLLALALLDVALASRCLAGISVELPAVARMSKDNAAKLEVRIRNEPQTARTVCLALPLPPEIESPQDELPIALPARSEWSRLAWPCLPLKRGNYRLVAAYLEGNSRLGFWGFRAKLPAQSEIRVYPNLLSERKNLAALFLRRGAYGVHAQQQVGKGREFEKLREYIPGDSFDEIHWKATAKRGRPITKVFQIERTQEVYVLIDASRLSARAGAVPSSEFRVPSSQPAVAAAQRGTRNAERGTSTLERYVTAALVLGLAAEQQGDLFGLLTFADKVESFLRARNGKAHYSACRDALYTLHPRQVNPDFDEVCTFIRLRLRRRALLVFLTALDDPMLADSFVRNVGLLCRQHLVLVNMVQPPGAVPLFSNPDVKSVNDMYEHLGGHIRWHSLRELGKVLQRRGASFSVLADERLSAQLVSQYLNVKRRQVL